MKELALIMPVYNEEACIGEVIQSWHDEFKRLKINFIILILNDGSRDHTAERLKDFSKNKKVEVIHKENSGHGSTILMGYHLAVEKAKWVFQVDSDNEIRPDQFVNFWEKRENYDGLFGIREGRLQEADRKTVSLIARNLIYFLYGKGVADPNVPFRLLRAEVLKKIIFKIPLETFAPNVIISGAFTLHRFRIYNHPVICWGRETGATTLVSWKIWRSAFLSFWQTIEARYRLRSL